MFQEPVSGAAYLLRAEELPEPEDEYDERLLLREEEVEREEELLLWPRERLAGERPCKKQHRHSFPQILQSNCRSYWS